MTKPKLPEGRGKLREGPNGEEVPFGTWLRRQREARGVSLREIADSTRISLRYLEALETDRFDALPAPVFAKGFLREYARVVGLDPDEVVNLFLVAARSGQAPEDEVPPAAARTRRVGNPWGYGLLLGLAMVLLLAIAVALSFWAERRSRGAAPAVASVVPPLAADEAVAAVPRHDEGAPRPVGAGGSGEPVEPSRAAAPGPVSMPSGAAPTAVPTAPASSAPLVVTLAFSGDCWVEALVDGRRRPGELKISGESLMLEGSESVTLTLGNRAGVTVTANGQPIALPPSSSNVVRGLRIERTNLSSPAEAAPR
ncbi:MAG: helix-turn-helix domain-containing protein [Holophagales bacterium]|nr:MAG: helix-turn-helix domain-containing protein [Holophagales bacterium]